MEDCGFFESIPLWAVTLIGGLFITVLSFIMIMSVYGRFFKLYIYTAIALMVEVAERVKLRKLLRKTPRIAAAVNARSLPLHQFKEIKELLHGGRLGENLLHLFCGHIGKVGTPYLFKQVFFVAVQVTDKVGEPQGERIPFVGGWHLPVGFDKPLA